MLFLLTSYESQLSVENAMANNATETMADIVAIDNVTAEQGIFYVFLYILGFVSPLLNPSSTYFIATNVRKNFVSCS